MALVMEKEMGSVFVDFFFDRSNLNISAETNSKGTSILRFESDSYPTARVTMFVTPAQIEQVRNYLNAQAMENAVGEQEF